MTQDIWLLTPHWISTEENRAADFLSRDCLDRWNFRLEWRVFSSILHHFNIKPNLDAFTCRFSAQLPRFMSWYPDPLAVAQDALLQPWDPVTYLFPPVPLLQKVIQRINDHKVRAILVCPQWPQSLYWGLVAEMLVEPPMLLPYFKLILETWDQSPVGPYQDPLVALHLLGKNFL